MLTLASGSSCQKGGDMLYTKHTGKAPKGALRVPRSKMARAPGRV